MAYLFRTPIRNPQGPRVTVDSTPEQVALMRHFRHHGGYPVCVLIKGTVVTEKQVPTTQDTQDATWHYLGGHDYYISATEKALLEGAGYTVLTV